jgi:glycosyltransferase 2 family protein
VGICRRESFAGATIVLEQINPPAPSIVRNVGRNRLSVAFSLLIVAIAAIALYHLLRDIEVGRVVAAIEAQPWHRIAIATALVFAGYFNLIFYDLLALQTIGRRRMPFRVIAFASFTSYTIGHSLGAATLTCGLVRFRVYSFWNLTVIDIAKIAFISGMTYWIGNISVLGGAVSHAPQALGAIDHLPSWLNRLMGWPVCRPSAAI